MLGRDNDYVRDDRRRTAGASGSLQGVAAAPDGLGVFGVTYDGDLIGLRPDSVSGETPAS